MWPISSPPFTSPLATLSFCHGSTCRSVSPCLQSYPSPGIIIYCFYLKWIYIASVMIFMAGAAVASAAFNLHTVIVGRIIMGVGGAVVYQRYYTIYIVCLDGLGVHSNITT